MLAAGRGVLELVSRIRNRVMLDGGKWSGYGGFAGASSAFS